MTKKLRGHGGQAGRCYRRATYGCQRAGDHRTRLEIPQFCRERRETPGVEKRRELVGRMKLVVLNPALKQPSPIDLTDLIARPAFDQGFPLQQTKDA